MRLIISAMKRKRKKVFTTKVCVAEDGTKPVKNSRVLHASSGSLARLLSAALGTADLLLCSMPLLADAPEFGIWKSMTSLLILLYLYDAKSKENQTSKASFI